jgi:hypothetical protein
MTDSPDGASAPQISVTLEVQNRRYSGRVPDDQVGKGVSWRHATSFAPAELKAARATEGEPALYDADPLRIADFVDVNGELVPIRPQHPGGMVSTRLTRAEADIARYLVTGLSGGTLRAYGRRAGSNSRAPYEWIPQAEWERVPDLSSMAWDLPFQRPPCVDSFVLHAGEPAWLDVRVVRAATPTRAEVAAAMDGTTDGTPADVTAAGLEAISDHTPPAVANVGGKGGVPPSKKQSRNPGGYSQVELALFPDIFTAIKNGEVTSAYGAVILFSTRGHSIPGRGGSLVESRAKRIAPRYNKWLDEQSRPENTGVE